MNTISSNRYLSNCIYDNLVPKNHFLKKLNELFDWHEMVFELKLIGKNDHGGRPRYSPVILFKMLFLSFLYDTSDRDTEELCSDNISCKYFLGLQIDEPAPDYSTLSVFRKEIIEIMGEEWLLGILRDLVREFQNFGVQFGGIYALDATHTIANVDTHKDKEQRDGNLPPRDPDARWGAKGTKIMSTPQGEKMEVVNFFYGYKAHLLAETAQGFITAADVSPGNAADIDAGEKLIIQGLKERERKQIDILTADKAYGDGVLIGILERDFGLKTALGLNGQFFKGKYKNHWESYRDDPARILARKKRSVIERVNADLKDNHGLRRCRYLGMPKYRLQTTMAVIAHNLKLFVRLIAGVRFRPI